MSVCKTAGVMLLLAVSLPVLAAVAILAAFVAVADTLLGRGPVNDVLDEPGAPEGLMALAAALAVGGIVALVAWLTWFL